MRLPNRDVPLEFLHALPEGIKFVNKQGSDFLIVDHICCPNGHNLVVDSVKVHGENAIRVQAKIGATEGHIFLDPFWGGHEKLYSFIPDMVTTEGIAEIACPTCGTSMVVDHACGEGACTSDKHIMFTLPGGRNKVFCCARLGCHGHTMDITDVPEPVTEQVNAINFFGSMDADIFAGI